MSVRADDALAIGALLLGAAFALLLLTGGLNWLIAYVRSRHWGSRIPDYPLKEDQ